MELIKLVGEEKLRDKIDRLPPGIIDKSATGIGATFCELHAERNSILVMPTKSLAYSKASQKTGSLYVGSEYKEYGSPSPEQIKKYHLDKDPRFKKIIVVADSLPKVVEAIGKSVYQDYFLMIDEIDTFQADSNFRSAMELCIDYYFAFRERCMVSATLIKFTNKHIRKEPRTKVTVSERQKQPLKLIRTNNISFACLEVIRQLINSVGATEKIAVFNASLESHIEIINMLSELENSLGVKVLCGQGSADKVKEFYGTLEESKLPGRLNFLTSAYFSGLDIYEKYHAIILSEYRPEHATLTDSQVKQIAGRARNGHLSLTLICPSWDIQKSNTELTRTDLVQVANQLVKAEKCVERLYRDLPAFYFNQRREILEFLMTKLERNGTRLTRINREGKVVHAYFNIDITLYRASRLKELYLTPGGISKLLRQEFSITESKLDFSEGEKHIFNRINARENKKIKVAKALEAIKSFTSASDINIAVQNSQGYERNTYLYYYRLHNYLEFEQCIEILNEYYKDRHDSRQINKIIFSARLLGGKEDIYSHYLSLIKQHFPIGSVFDPSELLKRLKVIHSNPTIEYNELEATIGNVAGFTELNIVKKLRIYLTLKKKKITSNGYEPKFEVVDYNPYKLRMKNNQGVEKPYALNA